MRDYIFQCERELLDTIEYRLQIDLPYHYLIEAVNRKTSRMLRGRTGQHWLSTKLHFV